MLTLNGVWEMQRQGEEVFYPATVPGSLYQDLLNNHLMEDPFYGENEPAARELSAFDYNYRRSFQVPEEVLKNDRNILVCEGIDTLAEILVNGQRIGRCENMHRTYRFDVTQYLRKGANEIVIQFASPLDYIRRQHERKPIWGVDTTIPGFPHIRKAHCMFGWDWGPQLPDLGIWRDIYIEEIRGGRIDSVYVRENLKSDICQLTLEVCNQPVAEADELVLECMLYDPQGEKIAFEKQNCKEKNIFSVMIENPRLWWPHGYGSQPLYNARLTLKKDGVTVSEKTVNIGIRDFTVVRRKDCYGESFTYRINGREVFARGANYIPEDSILSRRSRERTARLLSDCVRSGFNCIRVWGGGHYPDDWFFEECDRLGLLVWEDFMFACAVYDLTDAFAANIKEEFIDNIRRLRNHPSLGLWCGNNEMESAWVGWGLPENEKLRQDYLTLYERMIPEILAQEDPDRFYWPSSPSSGGGFEDPGSEHRGDAHYWDVWHGKKPFEEVETKYFRFFSEYGFVSVPSRKTLETVIDKDQFNIVSPQMEMHQKCALGNLTLMYYLLRYYQNPSDFDTLIYATQSLQGDYLEMAIRHLRSHRERCAGSTYWQINDTYPTLSWATIDYFGRWKGSQYIVKRSYRNVISYAELDEYTNSAIFYVSGELLEEKEVTFTAQLVDQVEGILEERKVRILLPALSSVEAARIRLPERELCSDREKYLHYSVCIDGEIVDEGNRLLSVPKQFRFRDPKLQVIVSEKDGTKYLTVRAQAFARRVAVDFQDIDVILSDNYFDLQPGEEKAIRIEEVRSGGSPTVEELQESIQVYSNINIR